MVRLPPARTRTDTRFPSTTLFRSGDGTTIAVPAPMQGTVGSIAVSVGDEVAAGATVAVMEAMKMEHVVAAPRSGIVRSIGVRSEEHTSELQSLMRSSYAVFCLKKKTQRKHR